MKPVKHSWGFYPKNKAERIVDIDDATLLESERFKTELSSELTKIALGNGRSYGDSAQAYVQFNMLPHNYFLNFDDETGYLTVQSGVLLSDILKSFVPRGWFLHVSPGTKLITVGGAIASDVHGKNHHVSGCFSESIIEFELLDAEGKRISCSKTKNQALFEATCGGQGLTGVITKATIQLIRISSSQIKETTYKTQNLKETFEIFESNRQATYSVAWIDCLSRGKNQGRSLVSIGEFANDGVYEYAPKPKLTLPFFMPSFLLNSLSIKLFNQFYFHRVRTKVSQSLKTIDQFFYPLDAIGNWNKMYGKAGFVQYQFILPLETSEQGMQEILERISKSKKGSFLAVLKLYGSENKNYLSFPMEGYSLALDFKVSKGLFDLLEELDQLVLKHNGRIYLAKDARVSKQVFEQGYPRIEQFRQFRKSSGTDQVFQSFQSTRLGI